MATVRVLPALIAVSIGALAFKSVDLAQAVAEAVDENTAPATPETALTAGVGDHAEAAPADGQAADAPPAAPDAAKCLPSVDYAAEMGVSSEEILVLRSLAARREELAAREAAVETREQAAAAAEGKLNEQIAGLKTLEGEVNKIVAQMDAKADERMTALVKTYETMKAKDAAAIFDTMDDTVLLGIAKSMKPATLGPIMAVMDRKRAEALTKLLANLAAPPASLDALKKTDG
jgi:flagellar motility protein MotE (MotC chaperone)